MPTIHHHHHSHQSGPLEVKQLAEFDASLGEAPEQEKRRKRIVYLRDAVRQMQMGRSLLKGFGCLFIPFAIIPIFWPFLFFFWLMRRKSLGLMDTQLNGALDYWGIRKDELYQPGSNESFELTE